MKKQKIKNQKIIKSQKMIKMNQETKYIVVVFGFGKPLFVGRDKMNPRRFAACEDSSDALKAPDLNTAELVAQGYIEDNKCEDYDVKIYPLKVSYEVEDV